MTIRELTLIYPDSFFNDLGELIYVKKTNRYIVGSMLKHLGTYHTGFRNELYVRRATHADGYHFGDRPEEGQDGDYL